MDCQRLFIAFAEGTAPDAANGMDGSDGHCGTAGEEFQNPCPDRQHMHKRVFTDLADWWTLVPDQTVLASGESSKGNRLNLAGRSTTGKWIVAYVAGEPKISVKMRAVGAAETASATWIDPVTGHQELVGVNPANSTRSFTRPKTSEW